MAEMAEVRASEARLTDILDHAHDLIHSTGLDGRILYTNEAWRRRMGYTADDLETIRIRDLVHPDDLETFDAATERIFRGEAVTGLPLTFRTKEGEPVLLSASSNCRFEGGEPVATRTILRDLSEIRAREIELARIEANLRAVFESTGDPIWSVDREGRLVTFNAAFTAALEGIVGRRPEVGEATVDIMGEEAAEWFHRCYARALMGRRFSGVREERFLGEKRVFEMFFNPIQTADGEVSGVVVFARDATRRHRVEEELRRARRQAEEASETKSHFMASMSHELRTPLNSVIGFSNLLLRGAAAELSERDRGFLERIQANGKHLLHLINEILDLSKIEAGRMELELEPVALDALAEETIGQLESQVVGRPLRLLWEVVGGPASVPVTADRARLKQVLINLVGNALKFTESGEVRVRVEVDDAGRPLRISVRDTGIGIPEDRLEAIFRAFEQADSGTARRFGGTGLGLAISRSLCDLMGFELQVRSEVGKGSDFSIEFGEAEPPATNGAAAGLEEAAFEGEPPAPVERREEAEKAPDAEAAPPGTGEEAAGGVFPSMPFDATALAEAAEALQGRTVLVVDDEEDSRTLLRVTLEELGCRVLLARDGAEGLEVARRARPDLITLDLMMPRMTGWEMLRGLREDARVRDIPVVVVSLVAGEEGRPVLGSVDLLPKPVDRETLLPVLERNLERRGSRILVVDAHPASRLLVTRYLRDAGFQVHAVEHGVEALQYLKRVPVELVVSELDMPVIGGVAFLRQLRDSQAFREIPLVVLASRDITPEEEVELVACRVHLVRKEGPVEEELARALRGALDPAGSAGETEAGAPGTPGA